MSVCCTLRHMKIPLIENNRHKIKGYHNFWGSETEIRT